VALRTDPPAGRLALIYVDEHLAVADKPCKHPLLVRAAVAASLTHSVAHEWYRQGAC
jgi:hypothetical protein